MSTTQTVPQGKDTAIADDLYVSLELGDKSWKVTASDGHRSSPSRYNVDAGDTAAVVHCIGKARERCRLEPQAKMHCCYEAGRDGWWLHRWLIKQGIDNIVVDSSSIEVNRHARRAKTDRIDGDKCVFRTNVTGRFGSVTAQFGSVTGHSGDVTATGVAPA